VERERERERGRREKGRKGKERKGEAKVSEPNGGKLEKERQRKKKTYEEQHLSPSFQGWNTNSTHPRNSDEP